MSSALESTLAVGALTLVLAVVLVSCGGGGGRRVLCRQRTLQQRRGY